MATYAYYARQIKTETRTWQKHELIITLPHIPELVAAAAFKHSKVGFVKVVIANWALLFVQVTFINSAIAGEATLTGPTRARILVLASTATGIVQRLFMVQCHESVCSPSVHHTQRTRREKTYHLKPNPGGTVVARVDSWLWL